MKMDVDDSCGIKIKEEAKECLSPTSTTAHPPSVTVAQSNAPTTTTTTTTSKLTTTNNNPEPSPVNLNLKPRNKGKLILRNLLIKINCNNYELSMELISFNYSV